uniref:Wsv282-like protein n=1 Tax=Trachysalambria curvirostris nimavirus TaxID=2984282 RepID=A0A9C7EZ17_9VIRU|nr:MAG: wsv282-like protein [Trachysalambria curvirostris nimavirus]
MTMNNYHTSASLLYEDLELTSSSDDDNDVDRRESTSLLSSSSYTSSGRERLHLSVISPPSSVSCDEYDDNDEEEEDYDPDKEIVPGCSSWGLIMSKKRDTTVTEGTSSSTSSKKSQAPVFCRGCSNGVGGFINVDRELKDHCLIPCRVLSMFSSLLEKDKFHFTQSVTFLGLVRRQVNEAMHSAFSALLTSSGFRRAAAVVTAAALEDENRSVTMSRILKTLSDIASSSNPENGFLPAASIFSRLSNKKIRDQCNKRRRLNSTQSNDSYSTSHSLSKVCSKVIFYREIHAVISVYLSLVYIQRAMNNNNTNSIGYPEGMVAKMLDIIDKIPHDEMNRDKYISVGRDALFLYQNIITDVTGPRHSKRLRTPQQQAYFCYVIAMLVNDQPIASDVSLTGKATNLVQFASAMIDPAYRLAVHKMASVTNSSYTVFKVLGLDRESLARADAILAILSARSKPLGERKPRTLAQSVFLYLYPNLRDKLRASGLIHEESSLGTAVRLVSQQLIQDGITTESLEEGYSITCGSYISEGNTLKCFGPGSKDIKTVALATLMADRLRRRMKRDLPYY